VVGLVFMFRLRRVGPGPEAEQELTRAMGRN
jgi:hypothetical protein